MLLYYIVLSSIVLLVTPFNQIYSFSLTWRTTSLLSNQIIGEVWWNNNKILNLYTDPTKLYFISTQNITLLNGPNDISISFTGSDKQIQIASVQISSRYKKMNLLYNGDFSQQTWKSNQTIYKSGLTGWNGNIILVKRKQKKNVILNKQNNIISQSISFGQTTKYQFISTFQKAISNKAQNILNTVQQKVRFNSNYNSFGTNPNFQPRINTPMMALANNMYNSIKLNSYPLKSSTAPNLFQYR